MHAGLPISKKYHTGCYIRTPYYCNEALTASLARDGQSGQQMAASEKGQLVTKRTAFDLLRMQSRPNGKDPTTRNRRGLALALLSDTTCMTTTKDLDIELDQANDVILMTDSALPRADHASQLLDSSFAQSFN
ncbi:hypothetical protein PG984_005461 [Apiospora sp. TS-2023a]